MIYWISFVGLGAIAFAGYMARRRNFDVRWLDAELSILGGMSLGMLLAWVAFAVARVALLMIFCRASMAVLTLFLPECLILVCRLGLEWRHTQGVYDLVGEWRSSIDDGVKFAVVFLTVATFLSFGTHWLIKPGKRGRFEGTVISLIVPAAATKAFAAQTNLLEIDEVVRQNNRNAIPDAIVLATLAATGVLFLPVIIRDQRRALNADYLHLPKSSQQEKKPGDSLPTPRGGGPN